MDKPLFSIIIPHYDIPDLLMRCLKSIPVSEDIQVIVVDDNSADADTYLDTYPELSRPYLEFIRTKTGGGAGYARNVGLEHAKGKWLLFADADDFYVDDMYDIISMHVKSDADVIYFQKQAVYSDNLNRKSHRSSYVDEFMDIYFKTGDELPIRTRYP
jgi:glycosyltransferase involved in cell wall biosynthesis